MRDAKGIFVEKIQLSICSTMRHWWEKYGEASLEDFANHSETLLNWKGITRNDVKREIYNIRSTYHDQNEKNKNRRVIALQSSGMLLTGKKIH